jgi:hypothetical protein
MSIEQLQTYENELQGVYLDPGHGCERIEYGDLFRELIRLRQAALSSTPSAAGGDAISRETAIAALEHGPVLNMAGGSTGNAYGTRNACIGAIRALPSSSPAGDEDHVPRIAYCCRCGKSPFSDGAQLTCGCWTCSPECWEAEAGPVDALSLHQCPTTLAVKPATVPLRSEREVAEALWAAWHSSDPVIEPTTWADILPSYREKWLALARTIVEKGIAMSDATVRERP